MADSLKINGHLLTLLKGDITDMEFESFVFYASHDLRLGAGFGNAIAVRGGQSIQAELDKIGKKNTCDVVISKAGKLKAKAILHAVGPRFKEPDTEVKLEKTIINAMKLGEDNNLKQIAFPPMGAGFYAIPLDTCAKVMMKTLKEYLGGESSVQEVIICANDNREYQAFKPYFL